MSHDEKDTRTFGQRYGFALGVAGVLLLVVVIFAAQSIFKKGPKTQRERGFTMVQIPPPPSSTPPPTPPPVIEEKKQEMIEQDAVTEEDTKPEPPQQPAPDLGTGIKGNGADAFGLSGRGNGLIGGKGSGGSRSKWGWYAAEVQRGIAAALQKNRRTRSANLRVTVRVWPDASGRITRAMLGESTGDSALDAAITNEVLTGLQLQEPPPAGMPSPIVLRITARRPN
jgi:periplasmic protein TonB